MKRRFLYLLLFGFPGLVLSAIISILAAGTAAGILWLFVYGDSPWPASSESLITLLAICCFLGVWISSLIFGYKFGKRREQNQARDRRYVLASLGMTLGLVLLIVLYQVRVGNMGPKSDSTICSDFCAKQGLSGSSMPPRNTGELTCSCLDQFGKAIITVPIESIARR